MNKPRDLIYQGFWSVMDWIYPPSCASCGEPGYRLCPECEGKIKYLVGNKCQICGESIHPSVNLCLRCQSDPPPYHAMRNLAVYEGVMRECVHALKYQNNQSLGEMFSRPLAEVVRLEDWKIDKVVPVPLSPQRYTERGYNQAALLAKPLAARIDCLYDPFCLIRTRDTPSQVGLSGKERRQNVIGAFKGIPELVEGKSILLIDDVMTTGSTMAECTRALKNAGAEVVYCLTLGRYAPNLSAFTNNEHQV
ncbi:MAG: ComF family protein [Anaerolineales bacterium]